MRTHVFAVHGDLFVDCQTQGMIRRFTEAPADMKNFRIKAEFFFE